MYKKNLEYGVFYVKNITIIMTLKKGTENVSEI